ncbi:hypothetical protein R6Q59_030982 [Mikania micrantha]
MSSTSSNDGRKRCKCKKSKCLKLYCECFATGFYCDASCSCHECFNNPDYEDIVEESRQLIASRNPNAFSSKIHGLIESPTSNNVEDGDQVKPVAGKHRWGCNCKKSMCQKKYCECNQAKVGCSDECRCQGCKNAYGKKADYNVYNKMQLVDSEFSPNEFNNPHNLTPLTPFQHNGHQYDPLTSGTYISSSESANSDMMLGTPNQNFDMVTFDQQAYPNASMNQFTPPYATNFHARHLHSVMNIPPMMDLPSSSTASESCFSMISWPGSSMTPVTAFSGPTVMNTNDIFYTGGVVPCLISPDFPEFCRNHAGKSSDCV